MASIRRDLENGASLRLTYSSFMVGSVFFRRLKVKFKGVESTLTTFVYHRLRDITENVIISGRVKDDVTVIVYHHHRQGGFTENEI